MYGRRDSRREEMPLKLNAPRDLAAVARMVQMKAAFGARSALVSAFAIGR